MTVDRLAEAKQAARDAVYEHACLHEDHDQLRCPRFFAILDALIALERAAAAVEARRSLLEMHGHVCHEHDDGYECPYILESEATLSSAIAGILDEKGREEEQTG